MIRKTRLILCLVWLCLLMAGCAQAEEWCAVVPVRGGAVNVYASDVDGEPWFFLPTGTRMEDVQVVRADGSAAQVSAWEAGDEPGVLTAADGDTRLYAMQSENIRSLFLFSDDPVNAGREYIDNSEKHSTSSTGSLVLLGTDRTADHAETISKLRGRGNGTWHWEKKAYQIKLKQKADLLDTGNADERSKTWILLAMATDSTYLHDKMTFDLALELGDETASRSEYVNLYYDGDYRGLYLLCEKTELGSGRIDELDYDHIIKELFQKAGRSDLEMLTAAESQNDYGNGYAYLQNMTQPNTPGTGAFLLEMEHRELTLSDPCWFTVSNGTMFASKNPEKASDEMMRYVSQRLEEALATLQGRGVNPQNGRTLQDDFDVESFARSVLLSELSFNSDSYWFSSTFFILPAGEKQFTAGPPWDYDLAYRWRFHGDQELGSSGFRDKEGWIPDFLSCCDFRDAVKTLYTTQVYPLITDVLLGTNRGTHLQPIDEYVSLIDTARRMNEKIWQCNQNSNLLYGETFEEDIELLKRFLTERGNWLYETVLPWNTPSETIELWADAAYTNVGTDVELGLYARSNMELLSWEWTQVSEATEEDYALWQMTVELASIGDFEHDQPSAVVNGHPVSIAKNENGTFTVSFVFEDPSYRPCYDDYGEDLGLVYDFDIYTRNYPEVAEMCDYDPEQVLAYFVDEGMYEGHKANGFFSPQELLDANYYLNDYLGEDWWLYYSEYISYGYSEWVLPEYARFELIPLT